MSVKLRPVSNRYLDMLEKERAYSKHVHAVVRSKASINTTQPETPRRLLVAERNNTRHRNGMLRTFADHDRMIAEVEERRYKTASIGTRSMKSTASSSSRFSNRNEFSMFGDVRTPQPKRTDRFEQEKVSTTPQIVPVQHLLTSLVGLHNCFPYLRYY